MHTLPDCCCGAPSGFRWCWGPARMGAGCSSTAASWLGMHSLKQTLPAMRLSDLVRAQRSRRGTQQMRQ